MIYRYLIFVLGSLFIFQGLKGQLSGYNLMEFQYGNIPNETPNDLSTHYDQLFLQYRHKSIKAKVMIENFVTSETSKEYLSLSQYQLNYSKNNFKFTTGHFYEMIGRGLLLRAYEIKGSVFEDQTFRIRQGFYNDIKGFSAKYTGDKLRLKILRGRPLLNILPPTFEEKDRRPDLVEAIEGNYSFLKQEIGIALMRNLENNYTSISLGGNLPFNISYYSEWAQEIGNGESFGNTDKESSYAYYLNTNYSMSGFGVSLELKKYQKFLLGSGINYPPALVKEQSYRTLNRSIHTPQLSNEKGIQSEFYYSFENNSLLTFNFTRLTNKFSSEFIFNELFLEYYFYLNDQNSIKLFADYSKDEIVNEKDRYTTGIYYTKEFKDYWSSALEVEFQDMVKHDEKVNNAVVALSLSKSTKFTGNITWEISNDPIFSDDNSTFEIEKGITHWIGSNISYKYQTHTFTLFAGKRRGGPACSSGICYEILDFSGLELRITSKF